jgi:CBS domain-containing protein
MKVSVILLNKGSNDVATIGRSATIADAVRMLAEKRIGALVVSDGNAAIHGILSERDIVAALGTDGAGILERQVDELMTENVEACIAEDTAFDVLGRMTAGRFRHMPVLDADRKMIGILSIGDVVKARLEEIESENAAMADMLNG